MIQLGEGAALGKMNYGLASIVCWVAQAVILPYMLAVSLMVSVSNMILLLMFTLSLMGLATGVAGFRVDKHRKASALIGFILNGMLFPLWLFGVIEITFKHM